jgi:preprotein translocase subunit SecE
MEAGRFWCAATSPERDTEAGSEEVTETEAIAEATGTAKATGLSASEAGGEQSPAEQSPERLSTEEIARQMAALRQEKAEKEAGKGEEEGLVGGVMEEVGLIQWPSFGSSLVNTVLVIVIVLGTSAMLFGINTALTELSGVIYSK